jgi:hypothetical protein
MGDILGLGSTHYPPLITPDEARAFPLVRTLRHDKRVPEAMKDPQSWPLAMRQEYGEDQGLQAARRHRERLLSGFRTIRAEMDAFKPDFILLWGDDQYENFREDIIPPFCVMAYEEMVCTPFKLHDGSPRPNVWGEPPDTTFTYRGAPAQARTLVRGLLEAGFDISYAYKPLHQPGLGHAFVNTLLYLDYDRQGFDYPVIPFAINCYGSRVIRNHGGAIEYSPEPDPPSPSPRRCFEVGQAVARIVRDSPWRVALLASSSWSHAFLTAKNSWLWPDMEADRQRFEDLQRGDLMAWRNVPLSAIEESGQQEVLNWMCLVGAMAELQRKPDVLDYVETYVFNSNKCMAVFRP